MAAKLSHVDERGRVQMVGVGDKPVTHRICVARGEVRMAAETLACIAEGRIPKGDVLLTARLAGIQAAKRTDEWIPLCHSIPLDHVDVEIELVEADRSAVVTATASARWTTGVEMEALVAVSAAGLALYDMAKAVDRSITITDLRLLSKEGGRSGAWKRPEA